MHDWFGDILQAVVDQLGELQDNVPELSNDDIAAWVATGDEPDGIPCQALEVIGFLRGVCATLDLHAKDLFAAALVEGTPLPH